MRFLVLALLFSACAGPPIVVMPDAGAPDALMLPGDDGSTPDSGLEDGGSDSAIVVVPDSGSDSGESDSGVDAAVTPDAAVEPDAWIPPTPDAGTDAGSVGPDGGHDAGTDAGRDSGYDAGYDSGPPPCSADGWEPNDSEGQAAVLATVTTPTWTRTLAPTFTDGSDWYGLELNRSTATATRIVASGPNAWTRVRFTCLAGSMVRCAGVCGEAGRDPCGGTSCERVALGGVTVTAQCSNPSAPARVRVEAMPASLAVCGYTLRIDVGS